ncbi:hypothetical protein E3N88_10462 [Mikania micrantha]|uniref:Protein kinase domain-containing protein n=1 Tax=Mikania micrantha TaxID=192012 RepID=A0A5N6PAJ8_9ASTR|nr:hypothetical protein E3N88_10462 [Mikania micrantha]
MSCFSCVKFCSKDVKNYDDDMKNQWSYRGNICKDVADGKMTDSIDEKGVSSQKANVAHTFTFHDLAIATHNFKDDNLIGVGGFGSVYKGQLESGEIDQKVFLFTSGYLDWKDYLDFRIRGLVHITRYLAFLL